MFDESTIETVAQLLDFMSQPQNAFGMWVATTGVIAGAYFLTPILPQL